MNFLGFEPQVYHPPPDNLHGTGVQSTQEDLQGSSRQIPANHSNGPGGASRNFSHGSDSDSSPRALETGSRLRASSLNSKVYSSRTTAQMTQQQINKKRQRATPDQLSVLEEAFAINPSPNARVRELLSAQINMTERSIQIWFQNRRAKTKNLHKKGSTEDSVPNGGDLDSMRPDMPARSYSIDEALMCGPDNEQNPQNSSCPARPMISRLNCRSLTIGTWRRVACTTDDLVLFFSRTEPKFTYYINSSSSGFKIEFNLSSLRKIDLGYVDKIASKEMGRITFSLASAPLFFLENTSSGMWKQCTDFTENQQATTVLDHGIVGPYAHLKRSLTELASIFTETIPLMAFEDLQLDEQGTATPLTTQSMVALSTQGSRIATQASGFATPEKNSMHQSPASETFGDHHSMNKGSHRRTRSRSAPIALDFGHFLQYGNIGGMPGYTFGQQSVRPEPLVTNHNGGVEATNSSQYEFRNPSFAVESALATTYPESWYAPSYSSTPHLDTNCSHLGSPMLAMTPQFEPTPHTIVNNAYQSGVPYNDFAKSNTLVTPGSQQLTSQPLAEQLAQQNISVNYTDMATIDVQQMQLQQQLHQKLISGEIQRSVMPQLDHYDEHMTGMTDLHANLDMSVPLQAPFDHDIGTTNYANTGHIN